MDKVNAKLVLKNRQIEEDFEKLLLASVFTVVLNV